MQKTLQDIPVCCCRQPAVFAEPVDIPQDVFPGNVFGRTLRQKAADDLQVVSGGCFCKPAPKEMASYPLRIRLLSAVRGFSMDTPLRGRLDTRPLLLNSLSAQNAFTLHWIPSLIIYDND